MNAPHIGSDSPPSPQRSPDDASGPRLLKDRRPLSVIIVEDDIGVAAVFKDAIEDHGGRVAGIAAEPSEAFGLVVEHRPDVVVMDVRLKDGHDGLHAADAMRLLHKTPIVFCTGYADGRTVERIKRFGGAPCLFKPVLPADLAHAILRACGLA